MKIKGKISILLSLFLGMSMLSGCASLTGTAVYYMTPEGMLDSTVDLAETCDVSKENDKTLSIYIWDSDANRATLEAAQYAYNQIDPDFKLNIIDARSWQKVEGRLSKSGSKKDASDLPDLTLMQDRATEFMLNTYPEIFSDISESKVNWSDFPKEKADLTTIDNVHYAYPYDNSTCVALYRTDILAEAGYTLSDLTGITWDRWIEIGRDVYDKTGKSLIALDRTGNDAPFIMMQEEGFSCFKDGEINITDNIVMSHVMRVIQKAYDNNCIYFSNNWQNYISDTLDGNKVCGAIVGTYMIPNIMADEENYGNWGMTTLPTFSGNEGYASVGGSSVFILSSCTGKKKELAIDFLDYTLGGGYGAQVTYERGLRNSGFLASYLPCGEYPPYREEVGYFNDQKIYLDILGYQENIISVEQNKYYYLLRTNLSESIQKLTTNNIDARPTIKNALAVVYHKTRYNIGNVKLTLAKG